MENKGNIIIYKDENGTVKANALFANETIWLTQKGMSELFDIDSSGISKHIKNIFNDGELAENSVIAKFAYSQKTAIYPLNKPEIYYNLDMIIAVGYRVNSKKATAFRIWATNVLKEFITKGFVLDDERLKNGNMFGKDYFRELLERIRDIRISEKRLYQQLKDIYALSADYTKDNKDALRFFATVQNKVHFAITGKTAPEIIYERANSEKSNMGLTSWKNSPNGKISKSDIGIAKNYLNDSELQDLRGIINMFLDYAEMQTRNNKLIYMKDWEKRLDDFIKFNEKQVLSNAGKISRMTALRKAFSEYDKYKELLRIEEKEQAEKEIETDIKELNEILENNN